MALDKKKKGPWQTRPLGEPHTIMVDAKTGERTGIFGDDKRPFPVTGGGGGGKRNNMPKGPMITAVVALCVIAAAISVGIGVTAYQKHKAGTPLTNEQIKEMFKQGVTEEGIERGLDMVNPVGQTDPPADTPDADTPDAPVDPVQVAATDTDIVDDAALDVTTGTATGTAMVDVTVDTDGPGDPAGGLGTGKDRVWQQKVEFAIAKRSSTSYLASTAHQLGDGGGFGFGDDPPGLVDQARINTANPLTVQELQDQLDLDNALRDQGTTTTPNAASPF